MMMMMKTMTMTQRELLRADPLMDLRPLRARTAACFLDGFAKIQGGQARISLPIFAAMSPKDEVRSTTVITYVAHIYDLRPIFTAGRGLLAEPLILVIGPHLESFNQHVLTDRSTENTVITPR
jgi:hypothetical protein